MYGQQSVEQSQALPALFFPKGPSVVIDCLCLVSISVLRNLKFYSIFEIIFRFTPSVVLDYVCLFLIFVLRDLEFYPILR